MTPRRIPTQTERDEESYLAKIKRDEAAAERLAVPHEVDDPVTGQYEGPDLDEKREERDLIVRVRHLEKKNDALLATVLKMSGIKFESNTTIIEANATFWRRNGERFIAAVIGLFAAIGAYFLGRGNTK